METIQSLRSLLLLLSISIGFYACKEDCSGYACFTPPSPIEIALLDENGTENLILNETINPSSIKIRDLISNTAISFETLENGHLLITDVGWESRNWNLSFTNQETELFQLSLEAQEITRDCCTFTSYDNIVLGSNTYENMPEVFSVNLNF